MSPRGVIYAVAGALTLGSVPVLGLKYSNPLVRVLVLVAEKVCLWPGIRLGGIAEMGDLDGVGSVAARCCLVVPADH